MMHDKDSNSKLKEQQFQQILDALSHAHTADTRDSFEDQSQEPFHIKIQT
jgi:hypothetical protein